MGIFKKRLLKKDYKHYEKGAHWSHIRKQKVLRAACWGGQPTEDKLERVTEDLVAFYWNKQYGIYW